MSDKYAGERYDPKLAMCGTGLRLEFDGRILIFQAGDKLFSYPAVSGKKTPEGRFVYTESRQRQSNIGPIPEGTYWINPSELWENAWYKVGSTSAWGNYRITIHPFTTTETYGRGGFFIHGGDTPGSIGCIDLATRMDQFVRDLLGVLSGKRFCQIHVKVKYPEAGDYPMPRSGSVAV
jgi:hypothetical protein